MPSDSTTPADPTAGTADSPAGGRTDLSHLRPDTLRLGGTGVFAGDWAWTHPADGSPPRIPTGFVGVLIDYWNGWAVFACTRDVAEAIVAEQQRHRETERTRLAARGLDDKDLAARLDETWAPMRFDGEDIVVDDDAGTRIGPGTGGTYVVCGWMWTWTAVDPADCDRIVGTIPPTAEHPTTS